MIRFPHRLIVVAGSAAVLTLWSVGLPLGAQEPGASASQSQAKTSPAAKAFNPAHRVPMYFGQLNLTAVQRESIYKIQEKHMPKIQDLEKQVEDLRAQMLKECERVLTADQRQALAKRREMTSQRPKRALAPAKEQ
jgi:hypothetical protein